MKLSIRYAMRPILLLLAAALTASASPAPPTPAGAARCTCISPKRPPCEVWWQTSAIFVGRVTRMRTVTDETEDGQERQSQIVTLRVQERWQGVEGERDVEVRTGAGGGDCGFDFRRDGVYLVYANASVLSGRLETGICSRTSPVEEAEVDLAYLRSLDDAEETISLYGMVYRERQTVPFGEEPDGPLDPGGPLPDVRVQLRGDEMSVSTRSDSEGWYEIEGLPEGTYDIHLEGPDIDTEARWRFHLPVAPACVWRNVIVDPLPLDGGTRRR